MTKLSLLSLMMRHKQARAPVKAMDRDRNITSSSVLSAPLPSSLCLKLFCMTYLVGSLIISLSGRGIISLAQGVLGVVFALEGFYGANKLDRTTLRRFILYLLLSIIVSIVFVVASYDTIDMYCSTAPADQVTLCQDITQYYLISYVGFQVVYTFIIVVAAIVFYRDVVKSGAPDEDHMVIFQDDLKVEPFIRKHDNLGR